MRPTYFLAGLVFSIAGCSTGGGAVEKAEADAAAAKAAQAQLDPKLARELDDIKASDAFHESIAQERLKKWDSVKPGMTDDEVKGLLGASVGVRYYNSSDSLTDDEWELFFPSKEWGQVPRHLRDKETRAIVAGLQELTFVFNRQDSPQANGNRGVVYVQHGLVIAKRKR